MTKPSDSTERGAGVKLTKQEVIAALHLLSARLHEALAFNRLPEPDVIELVEALSAWALDPSTPTPRKS